MEAAGSGHARIYQAQTQHFHHHGDEARGTAAVVVPVAALTGAGQSGFVGRVRQVDQLLDQLDPAGQGPVGTVVSAVEGMGGIGKTALAAHVASLAVGRGWFPGGAVLVDLHGYDEGRLEPGQVFGPMLRALGVDGAQVPGETGEQAAVYHHLLASLAAAGQRVLVVLDNASSGRQVADLLPRHLAHRVLVTTRDTLTLPTSVRRFDLGVLPEAEAVELLHQVVREQCPTDRRVTEQAGKAQEVVRSCGCLPLAVWIAGAILGGDADMPLADLADELADTHTRLDTLAHGESGVAAAFGLSWRRLADREPDAARVFWLLPVNPGPQVSTAAVAALVDQPVSVARRLLRVLAQAHLVERDTAQGRWRMHDLMHAYAVGLPEAGGGERTAAIRRLLRYYLDTADAADNHLKALPGQPMPDRFTGRQDALDWFDTERPSLLALVALAADLGEHALTVDLTMALVEYLSWQRHLNDWVTVATAARDATQQLNDRWRQGHAWNILGLALQHVRRFDEALHAHQTALGICRETGARRTEGQAWSSLGLALAELRRFDEAITAHQTARDICQQVGDRRSEAAAWNNLGLALRHVRRFDEAFTALQSAIGIYRQTRDRHLEGRVWGNLGLALREMRRYDDATIAYQHEIRACQETGDRHREATAWRNLGNALQHVRRFDHAVTALQTARDICQQIGDRHGEAAAWGNLGLTLRTLGRPDDALAACQHAIEGFTETGDTEEVEVLRRHVDQLRR